MHSPGGIYLGHHYAAPLEWKRLNRFFNMVARGLYWKKFEKRLPDDYSFEVRAASILPSSRKCSGK